MSRRHWQPRRQKKSESKQRPGRKSCWSFLAQLVPEEIRADRDMFNAVKSTAKEDRSYDVAWLQLLCFSGDDHQIGPHGLSCPLI